MSTLESARSTAPVGLLTGAGLDLGPHASRYRLPDRTMLRVLAERAESRADHPWLVFDNVDVLTFAEGYDLTLRVAAALRHTVDVPGKVAIMLRNQWEFMPSFYGAMAAGGIAVPLNAEARGPLLRQVLEISDATVLVIRVDLLDRLDVVEDLAAVEHIVAVGEGHVPSHVCGVGVSRWSDWLADDAEDPGDLPTAFDTALIQFTSGTTGTSKGAIYSHHFLYLYAAMIADSQGHGPDDVLSTPLPLYHVAALHIIANAALHVGCTAHLKSRFSAREFWPQIARDQATFAIILGPMAAIVDKTVQEAPPHRLKGMFCVPPPPGRTDFEAKFRVRMLWQGYGMTEVYPLPMPSMMRQDVASDTLGHP
ncbi:MAG: AMP-binding protein, partial [Nostocoides sp.]